MVRLTSIAVWVALAAACQAPFGADRHALVGDRIAAIEADVPTPGAVRPRASCVVGGRPWQDAPVGLAWAWLDPDDPDVDAIDPLGPVDGTGPAPLLTLPAGASVLGLVATFPSGAERRAILSLPEGGPTPLQEPTGLAVAEIRGLDALSAEAEALTREARETAAATPAATLSGEVWARLALTFPGPPPDRLTRTRWTTVGARGTFLELDALTTDWAPATLVLDDLEIEEATPEDPGPITFFVLALDDAGGTRTHTAEVWIGAPAPGLVVGGRWMASDTTPTGPLVRATLEADDDAPTGLRLAAARTVEADALPEADPYGTAALPCAAVDGPFDPDWLLDGRCLRADVAGATVVVRVDP